MAEYKKVSGDALNPVGSGPILLIHVVNDQGGMSSGFAGALVKKWPQVRESYMAELEAGTLRLGTVHIGHIEENITVINMVAQSGVIGPENPKPLSYVSLGLCLRAVSFMARKLGASVHGPKFGSGLAGGDWGIIEGQVKDYLVEEGVDVLIYDPEREEPQEPYQVLFGKPFSDEAMTALEERVSSYRDRLISEAIASATSQGVSVVTKEHVWNLS